MFLNADGLTAEISSSPFLDWARRVLLAHYVDRATAVPDPTVLPQPSDNRAYAIS